MNLELFDTKYFKKELVDSLFGSWSDIVFEEINKKYMVDLSIKLKELREKTIVYPEPQNVFRIYNEVAPNEVSVVINGSDPYYNNQASGISFECKSKISPSLQNIFEGIEEQFGECSYNINLKRWLEQGIFLINSILTVEKGKPLSHSDLGWQQFTKFTLSQLKQKHLVWLLFGTEAHKLEKLAKRTHLVIKTEHPAAASYGERKWRHNNCFILANEYLKDNNLKEIKW